MEVKKEVDDPVVPRAPPPPLLRNETPANQGKNLMKSAASLIGQKDDKTEREFALNACQNFLDRHKVEDCNISWFYHNNDVEEHLQDGPTCGLVALKLAADILKISPKSADEIKELLKVAQENGFTYNGEMFSAQDMGLLGKKYYELKFTVVNNGLEDYMQLIKHLSRGYPVLVPYDADRNHEPCLRRGNKAHWAVITGFLIGIKDDSIPLADTSSDGANTLIHQFHFDASNPGLFETKLLFLLARQGKSRHYAVWCWGNLNNSNKNLFEFDQEETSTSEKAECMFTEGVQRGLCSKLVLLFP